MKKQKIMILIFAALFVVLLVLYFAVISPLVNTTEETETETLETLDGEQIGSNNRYLMFEHIEKSSIQQIDVENQYGGYTFYRDSADDFQLKGYEGIAYDQELFSSLVVSAGYTLSMMRVTADATEAELEEYGLTNPQAKWTLTTTSGDTHTVLVGDLLITEGGYYAQYEGRNAVYILSTTLADTILQPATALMTPYLTAGMSTNDYFYATNFTLWVDSEPFIRIANVPDEEKVSEDSIVETEMLYPAPYTVNDTLYYEVLYALMALEGDETVCLGPTDDQLVEYGLDDPKYIMYYEFEDYEFYVFFSDLQDDGTYYAMSNLYNYQLVCKISASTVSWLGTSLFSWISEYPFQETITNVSEMTLTSPTFDATYKLSHSVDEETSNAILDVECDIRRTAESDEEIVKYIDNDNVYNFRQFYKSLLAVTLEEYTPLTDEEKAELEADDSKLLLTFSYTKLDGETIEYKFYQYSTRRAFVTINGSGEFYCLIDHINKLSTDAEKVLAEIDVNSYGKK